MLKKEEEGKSAGPADKTFAAFLRTAEGRTACGDLASRLTPSAAAITTQHALLSWARQRWPDEFGTQDWRNPPPIEAAPHGSKSVRRIWSRFLRLAEVPTP